MKQTSQYSKRADSVQAPVGDSMALALVDAIMRDRKSAWTHADQAKPASGEIVLVVVRVDEGWLPLMGSWTVAKGWSLWGPDHDDLGLRHEHEQSRIHWRSLPEPPQPEDAQ